MRDTTIEVEIHESPTLIFSLVDGEIITEIYNADTPEKAGNLLGNIFKEENMRGIIEHLLECYQAIGFENPGLAIDRGYYKGVGKKRRLIKPSTVKTMGSGIV